MEPVARLAPYGASSPANSLVGWLNRARQVVLACFAEQRRAKAAEEIYLHLSRLSDAELARRGLERARLADVVRERLY